MIRSIIQILLLTVIYTLTWIFGLMVGFAIFSPEIPAEAQASGFDPMMLVVSVLHVTVLYIYTRFARSEWLWPRLVLISFGLTYLITQIESLWFIDAVGMTKEMLFSLVIGGLISSILFSLALLKVIKKPLMDTVRDQVKFQGFTQQRIFILLMLIVVIWPVIYFLAGYYIAWQSDSVREYYTGSLDMRSFADMMVINFQDGLYTFQVFRSLIWLALAWLILKPLSAAPVSVKILLTGALFAVLGSSQLLLRNPMMPETVRYVHLLETAVSTFIWGGILGYYGHRLQDKISLPAGYA